MHVFTGCDTTSAFYERGKKLAFQLISKRGTHGDQAWQAMSSLGKSFDPLSSDALSAIEKFTCHMYGSSTSTSINEGRVVLNRLNLALFRHAKMLSLNISAEQTTKPVSGVAPWRLRQIPPPPPPQHPGQGWMVDSNGDLEIYWLSLVPAPASLLEFVRCSCTTGCKQERCSYRRQHLSCTDACKCSRSGEECTNQPAAEGVIAHDLDDED